MKPVIVRCRGVAFCALMAVGVYSYGRRLQVVYLTGKTLPGADVESRTFDWPWAVTIGADSRFCREDEPIWADGVADHS